MSFKNGNLASPSIQTRMNVVASNETVNASANLIVPYIGSSKNIQANADSVHRTNATKSGEILEMKAVPSVVQIKDDKPIVGRSAMSFASALGSSSKNVNPRSYQENVQQLSRQNFSRAHTSTSSISARAVITYKQRGTFLARKRPMYSLPIDKTCHSLLLSFIEPYFGGNEKSNTNMMVRDLAIRNLIFFMFNENDNYSLQVTADVNHTCDSIHGMTFLDDPLHPYLGTTLCAECILWKMGIFLRVHHLSAIKRLSFKEVIYPKRILERILFGMMLYHVRSNCGAYLYKPDDLTLYPTGESFKYVLAKLPTEFGDVFITEPCTQFPDLMIKSTGKFGGNDFILHALLLLQSFTHTFLVAGIENINIAPISYTDSRFSAGNNTTYIYQKLHDIDCSGVGSIHTGFVLPKKLLKAYANMKITLTDIIPCISVIIDGVKNGDSNQYRSIISEAINDAYIFILSKSVKDPAFVKRFQLDSLVNNPFIDKGTIKVLGDGHSVGFALYDHKLFKYEFTDDEFTSIINKHMVWYTHMYAMDKLSSIAMENECIDITYMARIGGNNDRYVFFRLT